MPSFDFKVHEVELERPAELVLPGEDGRHLEVRVLAADGLDRREGPLDADLVHDLEGSHHPAQPDLGPAVGVFDRGHPLVDQGRRHPQADPVEAIDGGRDLAFVGGSRKVPVLFLLHLGLQGRCRGVEGAELVAQGRGGVDRDGDAGDVHQLERPHADLEGPLGRLLDGRDVGEPLIEHAGGLVEEGDEEAIDRKAGGVLDHDGGLSVQLGRQQ